GVRGAARARPGRGDEPPALEPRRGVARHLVDLLPDLEDVGQVLRIGDLAARRLRLAVRLDLAVVDAVGEPAQPVGAAAHGLAQDLLVRRAHVPEPLDTALAQPRRRAPPATPPRAHRPP